MLNEEIIERINNLNTSGKNYLKTALSDSLAILKELDIDANSDDLVSTFYQYNDKKSIDQYKKIFAEMGENFNGLFQSLHSLRSSYLPYDFFTDGINDSGELNLSIEELSDQESIKESYENTFFRMLGMPSTSDINENDKLFCVNRFGEIEKLNLSEYELQRLDSRQIRIADRDTSVSIDEYNLVANPDPIGKLKEEGYDEQESQTEAGSDKLNSEILIEKLGVLKRIYELETVTSEEAQVLITNELLSNPTLAASRLYIKDSFRAQYDDHLNRLNNLLTGQPSEDDADKLLAIEEDNRARDAAFFNNINEYIASIIYLINPPFKIDETVASAIFFRYIILQDINNFGSLDSKGNFWRFSTLLFPAVQDGRIGNCINEPEKIVAEPFLPESMRKINGKTMRSCLLEAVIRIRLDIISGNNGISAADFSMPSVNVGANRNNNKNGIRYNDIVQNYGLLESYLIARLLGSFVGIAANTKDKIKEMLVQQTDTGYVPKREVIDDEYDANSSDPLKQADSDLLKRLNALKTIDDSMMLLLGSNGLNKALDLQENVARSSGVINAYFMNVVTSSIKYPADWVRSKIEKNASENLSVFREKTDRDRAKIDQTLGRSKGVGIIDAMSYIIALFTVDEEILIGLLTEKQFSYMKKEFPKNFFDGFEKKSISGSVNELSEAAYAAYELFRGILSDDQAGGLQIYND